MLRRPVLASLSEAEAHQDHAGEDAEKAEQLEQAGHDVKIVWRMTGSGDIAIRATDADGVESKPFWGPEAHGSSSWVHPGSEVGIGLNFPHAGCWNIHLARVNTSGDAWLTVS